MKKKITDKWQYLKDLFLRKLKKSDDELSLALDQTQELENPHPNPRKTWDFRLFLKNLSQLLVSGLKKGKDKLKNIDFKKLFFSLRRALTWENIKNLKSTIKDSSWREKLELLLLFFKKAWRFSKKYLEKFAYGRRFIQYVESGELQNLFFSPDKRGELHRIFLVLFFISIAFVLGKVLAMLVRPSEIDSSLEVPSAIVGKKMQKEDYDRITQKNLFQTRIEEGAGAVKKIDLQTICETSDSPPKLPITLVSSIILQNSKKSLVIVEVKGESGKEAYREGEKIKGLARIDKISDEGILLKNWNTGDCEKIGLPTEPGKSHPFDIVRGEEARKMMAKKMEGIENVGNKFVISKKILNKKLEDLDNILSQARAVQLTNPDGSLAFKITEIVPGSIFSYLGIENNDTITSINGKPVRGLNEVMNMFANIQNIEHLELSIRKEDGNEQNQEYSFSK